MCSFPHLHSSKKLIILKTINKGKTNTVEEKKQGEGVEEGKEEVLGTETEKTVFHVCMIISKRTPLLCITKMY